MYVKYVIDDLTDDAYRSFYREASVHILLRYGPGIVSSDGLYTPRNLLNYNLGVL